MTEGFRLQPATASDRLPLYRMLELYQHDLSDLWDQDLDAHGEFGYALDRYWSDPGCAPYVFLVHGRFAGLALVDRRVKLPDGDWWMDQFFVMKKYRRQQLGRQAAAQVFDRHPGRWQVGQMPLNLAAQAFWRSTIGHYTAGSFRQVQVGAGGWQGVVQCFDAPGPAPRPD